MGSKTKDAPDNMALKLNKHLINDLITFNTFSEKLGKICALCAKISLKKQTFSFFGKNFIREFYPVLATWVSGKRSGFWLRA